MRRVIGRVLSARSSQDGEIIVRFAKLGEGGGKVMIVRLDATEDIENAQALPLIFPRAAMAIFTGYYEGTRGFSAKRFEVIEQLAA